MLLRKKGVQIDEALRKRAEGVLPEDRFSVALGVRPSESWCERLTRITAQMRKLEPEQHYRQPENCFVELLRLGDQLDATSCQRLQAKAQVELRHCLSDMSGFTLQGPRFDFDRRACWIEFAGDGGLATLLQDLVQRLDALDLSSCESTSAPQISILRYLQEVTPEVETWEALLEVLREQAFEALPVQELRLFAGDLEDGRAEVVQCVERYALAGNLGQGKAA